MDLAVSRLSERFANNPEILKKAWKDRLKRFLKTTKFLIGTDWLDFFVQSCPKYFSGFFYGYGSLQIIWKICKQSGSFEESLKHSYKRFPKVPVICNIKTFRTDCIFLKVSLTIIFVLRVFQKYWILLENHKVLGPT